MSWRLAALGVCYLTAQGAVTDLDDSLTMVQLGSVANPAGPYQRPPGPPPPQGTPPIRFVPVPMPLPSVGTINLNFNVNGEPSPGRPMPPPGPPPPHPPLPPPEVFLGEVAKAFGMTYYFNKYMYEQMAQLKADLMTFKKDSMNVANMVAFADHKRQEGMANFFKGFVLWLKAGMPPLVPPGQPPGPVQGSMLQTSTSSSEPVEVPPEVFKAFDIFDKKTRGDYEVFQNISKELSEAWGREVQTFLTKAGKRQLKLLNTTARVVSDNVKAVGDLVSKWTEDNVKSGKFFSQTADFAKSQAGKNGALARKWLEKNKDWGRVQQAAGNLMSTGSHTTLRSEAETASDPVPPEIIKAFDIFDKKTRGDAEVMQNISKELNDAFGQEVLHFLGKVGKRQQQIVSTAAKVTGDNFKAVGDVISKWMNENVKNGKMFNDYLDLVRTQSGRNGALARKFFEKNKNWHNLAAGSLMSMAANTTLRTDAAAGADPVPPEILKAFDIADKKFRGDTEMFQSITKELNDAWGREVKTFLEKAGKRQLKVLSTAGRVLGENAKAVSDSVNRWVDDNVKNGKLFNEYVDLMKVHSGKGGALVRKWAEKNKNWKSLAAGSLMSTESKKEVSSAEALRAQEIDDAWKHDVAKLFPDVPVEKLQKPRAEDFLKWLADSIATHHPEHKPSQDILKLIGEVVARGQQQHQQQHQQQQQQQQEKPATKEGDIKQWLQQTLRSHQQQPSATPSTESAPPASAKATEAEDPEDLKDLPGWAHDLGREVQRTLEELDLKAEA